MAITFVFDDRDTLDALRELQGRVRDLRPAMAEIGSTLVDNIKLGFRDGSDPWGRAWEPLKHRDGQPLLDTGELRNSITFRAGKDRVEVGSNDTAGKVLMHQFGGVSKGRFRGATIPARPFLPIRDGSVDMPSEWTDEIMDIVRDHLEGA